MMLVTYLEKSRAILHSKSPLMFAHKYKLQIKDICEKTPQTKIVLNLHTNPNIPL